MADARPFDPALFADAAIDAETANLNSDMIQMLTGQPEWWIVGAAAMRAARRRGEGPFPAPVMSNRARTLTITGKDGSVETLKAGSRTQTARIEIMSWSCYGYSLQFAWSIEDAVQEGVHLCCRCP
jgi:hypothetical protein